MKSSIFRFSLLLLTGTVLAACGEAGYYYEEEIVYYEDDYAHEHEEVHHLDPPALYQFHAIDTYETSSEFDTETDLAISPYVNHGEFELYWETHSYDDYFVEFMFNTRPSPIGAEVVTSEWCGPYEYCNNHQYQFCEYTPNLYLSCETPYGDYQSVYIGDRLATIPEDGYFILQVCDSTLFYCEYQALPVSVE
ncbi:MAG: hypothetical protein K6L76_10975 [Agarilytica sp.]